MMVFTQINFY